MVESDATVVDVVKRTHNVKSFRLQVKEKAPFDAGQYLMVTVKVPEAVSKPLSISSSPTEKEYIEFTKKITGSEYSQALDRIKPGDVITVRYPFGKFTYKDNYPKLAFLSGGIGITPVPTRTLRLQTNGQWRTAPDPRHRLGATPRR